MSGHLALVQALDHLYAAVVADPESWDASAFADWMNSLATDALGPVEARWLRRGVRAAARLARYWSTAAQPADDWRSAVDMALGSRGWTASYELARLGAEATLDEALFDEMASRFRLVQFEPFPLTYDAWVTGRAPG